MSPRWGHIIRHLLFSVVIEVVPFITTEGAFVKPGCRGSKNKRRLEWVFKYPNTWYTCSMCPFRGRAMYVESIEVSSSMSTRPSSTAHHRTPISSRYLWTPSDVSSADTSRSGRYPAAIGVLHFDGNRWFTPCSSFSTFSMAAFTYWSDDMHQPWMPSSSMTDNVAPRYISGGSILSSFNLNMTCTALSTSFAL